MFTYSRLKIVGSKVLVTSIAFLFSVACAPVLLHPINSQNSAGDAPVSRAVTIVTNGLVLNLDAAHATSGGTAYPNGCAGSDLDWYDISGAANNGTLTSFASCNSSRGWNGAGTPADPYCLAMTVADSFVVNETATLDILPQNTGMTVEMWVNYPTAPTDSQVLFGYSGGGCAYNIWFQGAPATGIVWGDNCSGNTGPGWTGLYYSFNLSTWYHFVTTVGSGANPMANVYINGANVASATSATWASTTGWGQLNINYDGGWDGVAINYAKFAIYNRELTPEEVSQNCKALESRFSGVTCD